MSNRSTPPMWELYSVMAAGHWTSTNFLSLLSHLFSVLMGWMATWVAETWTARLSYHLTTQSPLFASTLLSYTPRPIPCANLTLTSTRSLAACLHEVCPQSGNPATSVWSAVRESWTSCQSKRYNSCAVAVTCKVEWYPMLSSSTRSGAEPWYNVKSWVKPVWEQHLAITLKP